MFINWPRTVLTTTNGRPVLCFRIRLLLLPNQLPLAHLFVGKQNDLMTAAIRLADAPPLWQKHFFPVLPTPIFTKWSHVRHPSRVQCNLELLKIAYGTMKSPPTNHSA